MRISKAKVIAAVAAAGLIAGASTNSRAADMPVKAPPATAAPNWTGWYVNGGGGYGMWAAESHTSGGFLSAGGGAIPVDPIDKTVGGKGWLGRVGGGYDYQFSPHIVAGVFADFDIADIKGTVHDPVVGVSADIKQSWAWAGGVRAGWLITPAILSYANAGYTAGHFPSATVIAYTPGAVPSGADTGFKTQSFTTDGWFLGGGTEVSLGGGLFWRNEYRLARYNNHSIPDINVAFSSSATPRFNDINFKATVQTFTTQLVYKFDAGQRQIQAKPNPVVAVRWTGLYANAGVGYGLWDADVRSVNAPGGLATPAFDVTQHSGGKGWVGRVGGGYDIQLMPRIVAGVFADFDASGVKGNIEDTLVAGDITQKWAWAAGARTGLLLTPDILGYVNAGYTSAHFSSATMTVPGCKCLPFTGTTTPAFTEGGWFAGGGTEYAVANGLFWRNEYRYAQYGTASLTDSIPGTAAILNNISFRPAVQTVTTQLVYKFATQ